MFDESNKISKRAWLEKLQTYLNINPMDEEKGLQNMTMCLDGVAYEWWHHGLITLGHNEVTTFQEFIQKMLKRFEQKNMEYFKELA